MKRQAEISPGWGATKISGHFWVDHGGNQAALSPGPTSLLKTGLAEAWRTCLLGALHVYAPLRTLLLRDIGPDAK